MTQIVSVTHHEKWGAGKYILWLVIITMMVTAAIYGVMSADTICCAPQQYPAP